MTRCHARRRGRDDRLFINGRNGNLRAEPWAGQSSRLAFLGATRIRTGSTPAGAAFKAVRPSGMSHQRSARAPTLSAHQKPNSTFTPTPTRKATDIYKPMREHAASARSAVLPSVVATRRLVRMMSGMKMSAATADVTPMGEPSGWMPAAMLSTEVVMMYRHSMEQGDTCDPGRASLRGARS